jgi:hypothetical protein
MTMLQRQGVEPLSGYKLNPRRTAVTFSPLEIAGAPRFLTDAEALAEEYHEPVVVGVAGHSGKRETSRNSKTSYRGDTIFNAHKVQHESRIEKAASQILQTWPDLADLWSQNPLVRYRDNDEKWHRYIFDYLAILKCGTRVAISVKPEKARSAEEETLRLIVRTPQTQFDFAILVTDLQATRTAAFNARFILWSRKTAWEEEIEAARQMMRMRRRQPFFWELFDGGIPHHGRRAAIGRLIDLGEISLTDVTAPITDYCQVIINL